MCFKPITRSIHINSCWPDFESREFPYDSPSDYSQACFFLNAQAIELRREIDELLWRKRSEQDTFGIVVWYMWCSINGDSDSINDVV